MGTIHYSLDNKNVHALDVNLVYISSSIYEGDWGSVQHSHSCMEFFFVVGGSGEFLIEDIVFQVQENDLILINPYIKHTERSLGKTPLEYIAFGVENVQLNIGAEINKQFQQYNLESRREEFMTIFNGIIKEMDEKKEGFENLCMNYLSVFLTLMMRIYKNRLTFVETIKDIPASCDKVKRYIDKHYDENITLNSLATVAHWDKYHLIHVFTKTYGISPINYLREKRILVCKALLENSDHSIMHISQITGFSSQSYFSQSFKGHVGLSPRDYRKLHKG